MSGYFTQILDRSNENMAEMSISPTVTVQRSTVPMIDPFEQTVIETPEAPIATQKANTSIDRRGLAPQQAFHTNYLTRHVTRIENQQQPKAKPHAASVTNNNRIPPQPAIINVSRPEAKDSSALPTINNSPHQPVEHFEVNEIVNIYSREKILSKEISRQEHLQKGLNNAPLSHIVPLVVAEKPVKQVVIEQAKQQPQLTIGRININVLPADKPQVIQKIETRTVVTSNASARQVKSKFVFGIGQL